LVCFDLSGKATTASQPQTQQVAQTRAATE